jgi:hypothetical protein
MEGDLKSLFTTVVGLSASKADETIRNKALSARLVETIDYAKTLPAYAPSAENGKLIYSICSTVPETIEEYRPMLVDYVADSRISS